MAKKLPFEDILWPQESDVIRVSGVMLVGMYRNEIVTMADIRRMYGSSTDDVTSALNFEAPTIIPTKA
jgi:hypothetical protein